MTTLQMRVSRHFVIVSNFANDASFWSS
jgi:hypothetical protein